MKNIRLLTIVAKDATIAWAFDKSADNASPAATASVPEAISSTSMEREVRMK